MTDVVKNELLSIFSKRTESMELAPEERARYFDATQGSIFPIFEDLGEKVAKVGKPSPLFSEKPTAHNLDVKKDGLRVGIRTPIDPVPIKIEGQEDARSTTELNIGDYNGANSVTFHTLDTGDVVVVNDNMPDVPAIVLNSPDALFRALPGINNVYNAGNAAAWMDRLLRSGALDQLENEINALAAKKK